MLRGILAALRAFVRALINGSSGSRRALPTARSQPPLALPAPSGSSPGSNSSSKVALMVVNPYLVHAYWDVDPSRLPPGTKCAVLRFHDVSEIAPGPPFDVDIDLRAPNWYVHLWSPAKSYYAALAVKTEGGEFIPLATSNRIETPRAWPVTNVGPVENLRPIGNPPAPPKQKAYGVPTGFPLVSAPAIEAIPATSNFAPAPEPPAVVPQPMHADEVLRQRLAQFYALRFSQIRTAKAMAAAASFEASTDVSINRDAETPAAAALPPIPSDLTALAEHQFSPGVPSSQLRDTPRAP